LGGRWERITDVENLIQSEHPTPRAELEKSQGAPAVTDPPHELVLADNGNPPQRRQFMRVFRSKKWLIVPVVGVAAAVGGGVAAATVTGTVLSDTHPDGGPANEVRMRVLKNEFVPSADQPTFDSGWHQHPGPVLFQVQEGRVSITQGPPCRTTKLGPGETYLEIPEHPVRATAKRAATFTATQFLAADEPLQTPADDPCPQDHHDD
jgi:hypothetical protein